MTSLDTIDYILTKISSLKIWFVFWNYLGCLGHFFKKMGNFFQIIVSPCIGLRHKIKLSHKTVWCEIKIRLILGALKLFVFDQILPFKVFTKSSDIFGHFARAVVTKMKPG
jgi:hypothetical protein